MIIIKYIAHAPISKDQEPHYLDDHLRKVFILARRFSRSFDPYGITIISAIAHDLGKKSAPFIKYITSDQKIRGSVKHALGGSIVLHTLPGAMQDERIIIAIAIVTGHHVGLPDLPRIFHEKIPNAEVYLKAIPELSQQEIQLTKTILKRFPELRSERKTSINKIQRRALSAYLEMLTRMCFSALVDADYLDTERYFNEEKNARRKGTAFNFNQLNRRLQSYMVGLREEKKDSATAVNTRRNEVYAACREAARQPLFYRSLIVPTGLAKTLASIAYGLEHIKQFNKKRIIVALPLVNIIDQTAKVYKEVFGADSVLEQHSQMSYVDDMGETMERAKLAAENWDSYPIIVTTTVELFESLFSNRTSKTRKLHRLADSVIILDEFQKLPIHVLAPIFESLHTLMAYFNVTVVLCSATPLSFDNAQLVGNLGKPVPIWEQIDSLFKEMRRVEYVRLTEPLTASQLSNMMLGHRQALCILNTRKDAYRVYHQMKSYKPGLQEVYHLSNRMCPDHRFKVITQIKEDLQNKKPVLVIATSLVEAGVDLDFPVVYRAISPLDSIIQAGGRANREGKEKLGKVLIFELIKGGMPGGIYCKGTKQTKLLLDQYGAEALHEPGIFNEYFRSLYALGGDDLLDQQGLRKLPTFSFETTNHLFKMIDEDTVSVLCENYREGGSRLQQLIQRCREQPYLTKEWYREAQMYAVSIYRNSPFFKENEDLLLEQISTGWYIWHGDYNANTGIADLIEAGGD